MPARSNAEGLAAFHRNRIGLFGSLALDCLPLEEAVNREDAAPRG
jgi:hypothetical protein